VVEIILKDSPYSGSDVLEELLKQFDQWSGLWPFLKVGSSHRLIFFSACDQIAAL